MELIGFLAFLAVSHFGAMAVFKLTTYHRYFWPALPLLVAYGFVVAWALYTLNMHGFFVWQLGLSVALLVAIGASQTKAMRMILNQSEDPGEVRFLAESMSRTFSFYVLSSVIYVVVFVVAYLWLFNM